MIIVQPVHQRTGDYNKMHIAADQTLTELGYITNEDHPCPLTVCGKAFPHGTWVDQTYWRYDEGPRRGQEMSIEDHPLLWGRSPETEDFDKVCSTCRSKVRRNVRARRDRIARAHELLGTGEMEQRNRALTSMLKDLYRAARDDSPRLPQVLEEAWAVLEEVTGEEIEAPRTWLATA